MESSHSIALAHNSQSLTRAPPHTPTDKHPHTPPAPTPTPTMTTTMSSPSSSSSSPVLLFACRPWVTTDLMQPSSLLLHRRRLRLLQSLLYDPAYAAQEMAVVAAVVHGELAARYKRDRLIVAESLRAEYERARAAEVAVMRKEVGQAKEMLKRELEELKPLALQKLIHSYHNAMAKAGGSSGGARGQLFVGGGSSGGGDDDSNGEEGEAAEEDTMKTTDPYGLSPAVGVGGKRLVTPSASSSSSAAAGAKWAKRMKTAEARAEKREELRERLTEALVGEEGAAAGGTGAEDLSALLGLGGEGGGGADEAALVSEAVAALNTHALAAKMAAAQREAQRELEREMTERFSKEVTKAVNAALTCAREELRLEYDAKLEEEMEKMRVMMEIEYDKRAQEMEEGKTA
jgi:hypothetical protein